VYEQTGIGLLARQRRYHTTFPNKEVVSFAIFAITKLSFLKFNHL